MNNITTFSAGKKNVFTWLAVICMILSAVARLIFFASSEDGIGVVLVHVLLPLAANLMFAIALPWKGEKQLYVTRGPVVLFSLYFLLKIWDFGLPLYMELTCTALCLLQTVLYCKTFGYQLKTKLWLIASYLLTGLFALDYDFLYYASAYWEYARFFLLTDALIVAGILFAILAAKKLPAPVEGEIRLMPGDRPDGRRVRTRELMGNLNGFFMVKRNESSNYIMDSVEITNIERYIHQKRKEGLKHFGIMHVLVAAYVRTCSQLPGLNRFFAGQQTFKRFDIVCNMVVKKEMRINADDTLVKVKFSESDTSADIYRKYDEKVQEAKEAEASGFDSLVAVINKIPRLVLKFTVWFLKLLDYFGLLPEWLMELSPFHASMFITSMGSLGIPPIYHHLYDFGIVPVFVAFGAKRSQRELDEEGNVVKKKYVDFTVVTDERTIDGFYYASALKMMKTYLNHPERLDVPPETVVEDIP